MYDYCVYNDCMYAAKATKGGILPDKSIASKHFDAPHITLATIKLHILYI